MPLLQVTWCDEDLCNSADYTDLHPTTELDGRTLPGRPFTKIEIRLFTMLSIALGILLLTVLGAQISKKLCPISRRHKRLSRGTAYNVTHSTIVRDQGV